MFDIGFSELLVIAIVALVVLGPERLPRVARTAGHLLGRFQRYANQVKSDISREMQLEDLKKMQAEMQATAASLEASVKAEMDSVQAGFEHTAQEAQAALPAPEAADLQRLADAADHDVAQMKSELARALTPPAEVSEAPQVPNAPQASSSPPPAA